MEDDQITVRQAAELLGVSVAAVHDAISRGALASRRLGSFHVLSRSDVLAYQSRHTGKRRPGPPQGVKSEAAA